MNFHYENGIKYVRIPEGSVIENNNLKVVTTSDYLFEVDPKYSLEDIIVNLNEYQGDEYLSISYRNEEE